MTRNLNRLSMAILAAFFALMISLVYWSVFASDSMLARDDNPRRVEAERALLRGSIYDRNGQTLAKTTQVSVSASGQPLVRRDYPVPEAATALGYYSLVHGVGGVEAAFDKQLRGDDLRGSSQIAVDNMLHRQQAGSDLRLTLDVKLQSTLKAALGDRKGAVIVIDVPTGAVLAMVSAPSFDPNKLDQDYDALRRDPAAPLLNRVTQGLYQPGGALQTIILASMITEKTLLDKQIVGDLPVTLDKLTLNCVMQGAASTLQSAYDLACPAPFADAVVAHPETVQKLLGAFGLLQAPTFTNFPTDSGLLIAPLTASDDPKRLRAEATGQGQLTVTPLQMVLVAATVANHGNGITPYLVDATRAPGAANWQVLPGATTHPAIITQDVSDSVGNAMRGAVTSGAAHAADRPGLTIRGHASIAYTGPEQQHAAWFIGYADLPNGHSIAVATVIDQADADVAANIGGTALDETARLAK